MNFTTDGLVLREVAYQDADKLLDILTPDRGVLTVKARGVRKSRSTLKSACQLLTYAEFTLFEYRNRFTVDEATPKEQFPELRDNIELLSLGSYFSEVAGVLAQADAPSPELLSLLLNSLWALAKLQKPQRLVKTAFELRAACLAGFAPELVSCAVCGSGTPDRFNLSHGVIQCAGCDDPALDGIRLPLGMDTLNALRYIAWCDPKKLFSFRLPADTLRELNDVTEAYLMTQLERSFPTLDFYKSLLYYGDTI